ncbi:ABC transporter ATP-binding protein [Ectobacillus polymachus]|uniref:ABC transporter ATP-binding protein n=1 Tax=Ectobacillus polymachus TaxID=1508806 RepID=UPI003A89C7A6
MEHVIMTNQVSKQFGSFTAVHDVSLRVPEGEIFCFLGPNGAGKSTTIRMLLGLITPTSGDITIFGESLALHRTDILREVGSLVESPSYYGHLTAYENLECTRKILQVDKKAITDALEIVGLSAVKDKLVRTFSLGMKQRLGIAQALLGKPKLLILDEPTNGLDPAGIQEIRDLLKRLPQQLGATILLSSHHLSEVELLADHVGIIHKGILIFQGSIQELRKKGASHLEIGVRPLEGATEQLRKQGYKPWVQDQYVMLDEAKNIAELNRELVMSGHDVYHLRQQKETLEDIFLALTEKEEFR